MISIPPTSPGAPPVRTERSPSGPPGLGTPAFERLLDGATHSVSRPGNRIRVFADHESFAERSRLARLHANEPAYLQTYVMGDDSTARGVMDDFVSDACPRRLIYDATGSWATPARQFDAWRDQGVDVSKVPKTKGLLYRWHQKLQLFGNKAVMLGGANVRDEYALQGTGKQCTSSIRGRVFEPWHDLDFTLEGPCVTDCADLFLTNLERLGKSVPEDEARHMRIRPAPLADGVHARIVAHQPQEDRDSNITQLFVHAVNAAQHWVRIETPYFNPPPMLRASLIAAAERGVAIDVLTSSAASTNHKLVHFAARQGYAELLDAGVRIFETDPMVHAKSMTLDDHYVICGSANLNRRSEYRDKEVALAFSSRDLARQLHRDFETWRARSRQMTGSRIAATSPAVKLLQKTASVFLSKDS